MYGASNFSRTQYNEAKMGAYYTEVSHCRDIRKMFVFPQGEVCCLEPSIGDGSAVIAVTGADTNPDIKIFGVELNDSVATKTKENPYVEDIVCCDFTDELMCRKNVFSFAFANPPYLEERTNDGAGKVRLERVFLDRICDYLKMGAILVWVVSENCFCDPSYLRHWIKDYDTMALYKFRANEYAKYHQIVAVGRKVKRRAVDTSMIDLYGTQWKIGNIPILPSEPSEKIVVNASDSKALDLFTTKTFSEKDALTFLAEIGINEDFNEAINRRLTVESGCGKELDRPPIPLKKDSKYLLLTSGFSDGFVGKEEDGNLHLMRGVAEVVENARALDSDEEVEATSAAVRVAVTSSTNSELRIIEADGKITLLK